MVIDYNNLPIWMFPLLVWTLVWKALAVWRAARKGHLSWFVLFFVINTFGILPILYVFFLKDIDFFSVDKVPQKKVVRKAISKKSVKSKVVNKRPKKTIPTLD